MAWHWRRLVAPAISLVLAAGMLFGIDRTPPLWRDEGWTLTVSRTLVERGHFGMLSLGNFAPPGLSASFPNVLSVATSFRLFGIGVWQGRLVGAFYMLAALVLLYHLASRLYNQSVAVGTLVAVSLMSTHVDINPLVVGRQVLAEPLMLFSLLAGYAALLAALRKSFWFLPLSMLFWGVALISKAQPLPFWIASLVVPLFVSILRKKWRATAMIALSLIGSYQVSREFINLFGLAMQGKSLPSPTLDGLYNLTVFVPLPSIRVSALTLTLVLGLPTLLALCYGASKWISRFRRQEDEHKELVRLALLSLAGSWLAWFSLLSVGWTRYLFPVTFVGSLFVSSMLYDLTLGFNLHSTLETVRRAFRTLHFDRPSLGGIVALLIIAFYVPLGLQQLSRLQREDTAAVQVAQLLNSITSPNALIESYDDELFFLLNRRYHYPPDQMSVEIAKRVELGWDVPLIYDPLKTDPDYLVVGTFGRESELYRSVLATNEFRLLDRVGRYDVYERVR